MFVWLWLMSMWCAMFCDSAAGERAAEFTRTWSWCNDKYLEWPFIVASCYEVISDQQQREDCTSVKTHDICVRNATTNHTRQRKIPFQVTDYTPGGAFTSDNYAAHMSNVNESSQYWNWCLLPDIPSWYADSHPGQLSLLSSSGRVVITGNCRAERHSIRTNQCPPPPSPTFFTGWMPFLSPNQQCQSTEGN